MSVFNLLFDCPFIFVHNGASAGKLANCKSAMVTFTKLTREGAPDSEDVFVQKLKSSLVRHSGSKQYDLDDTLSLNRSIDLEFSYNRNQWGPGTCCFRAVEKENGIFRKLVNVCGGSFNFFVQLFLEFGVGTDEEDQMKVESKASDYFTTRPGVTPPEVYQIYFNFNLIQTLVQKWATEEFWGKLTIQLRLTDKALNLVHLDNLKEPVAMINRKLLADAAGSGDAKIVAKNGKKFRCHKAFLTVQSEVFKTMFKTANEEERRNVIKLDEMNELSVSALLTYLYCQDIEIALLWSPIAFELLKAADKYEIPSLHEIMKDVILLKEDIWFEVETALQLWSFAKQKIGEEGHDCGFKEIFNKALSVIRSQSPEEMEECVEFKEMLRDPKVAEVMCISFLFDK